MIFGLRESKWKYDTGTSSGAGIGFILASGGSISLEDPSGKKEKFNYSGVGIGLGANFGIPKIPDITLPKFLHIPREPSATGAAASFTSGGRVYMTGTFHEPELKRSDLTGGTIYIDAGAGIVADGISLSIMLLGVNTALLMMSATMPQLPFIRTVIQGAPAMLVMGGFNLGIQPGSLVDGKIRAGGGLGVGLMFGHMQ